MYTGHKGAVYGIRFSTAAKESVNQVNATETSAGRRRFRFVTFSADCTARLWSATRSTSLQTFSGHSGPITCVAIDEERHYLYTGSSDGRIASWLMETGQRIHWFEGHSAPIINLLVSFCLMSHINRFFVLKCSLLRSFSLCVPYLFDEIMEYIVLHFLKSREERNIWLSI